MMKSFKIGMLIMGLILLAGLVIPVSAVKPVLNIGTPVYTGEGEHVDSVYLVAKTGAWVEDPVNGYGIFSYPNNGADLQFNAYDLDGSTTYAMISYKEPWGSINNVLKVGMTDESGNLKMKIGTGAFLNHLICNAYTGDITSGAKVWLVPTDELVINDDGTATFVTWHPAEYLFESKLITQTCEA